MRRAPFDVVVVPFPYTDALAEKRRPAVVVSLPEIEEQHGWLWLAMVTSAPGPLLLGDAQLTDVTTAGLHRPCRVRAAKLAVVDRARVLRSTGQLSSGDRTAVQAALAACAAW